MTEINYVVTVRGLVPTDLSRKVIEAHTKALKSRHCSRSRCGPGVITSKTAGRERDLPTHKAHE